MGKFLLPVWMTHTRIAGCYVHSGRTSGNKKRNSTREDDVIFFPLVAHHSFHPLILLLSTFQMTLLCPLCTPWFQRGGNVTLW